MGLMSVAEMRDRREKIAELLVLYLSTSEVVVKAIEEFGICRATAYRDIQSIYSEWQKETDAKENIEELRIKAILQRMRIFRRCMEEAEAAHFFKDKADLYRVALQAADSIAKVQGLTEDVGDVPSCWNVIFNQTVREPLKKLDAEEIKNRRLTQTEERSIVDIPSGAQGEAST